KIYVGSGDTAFFWWDPRTPLGSLYSFLGESCPSQLGVPLFKLVSDVRKNGSSWSLPPTTRSENQVRLLAFISSLPSSTSADSPYWSVDGIPQKRFISKVVWNFIPPSLPNKVWAPLVWHKGAIPRHSTTAWLFILN
ncbi:unnamed protein product, partial [Brassica oleracea]